MTTTHTETIDLRPLLDPRLQASDELKNWMRKSLQRQSATVIELSTSKTCEAPVEADSFRSIDLSRLFGCVVVTKPLVLPANANLRLEATVFLDETNALHSSRTSLKHRSVGEVLEFRALAEIADPVVRGISVDMVEFNPGPAPVIKEPRDPMCKERLTVYPDDQVAKLIGAASGLSDTPRMIGAEPSKCPGVRVIREARTEISEIEREFSSARHASPPTSLNEWLAERSRRNFQCQTEPR